MKPVINNTIPDIDLSLFSVEKYPGDQSAVSTIWFPKKINLYGSENFVSDNIGVFTGIFNFIYSNGRRDSSLN
jgi:hypothetical protein